MERKKMSDIELTDDERFFVAAGLATVEQVLEARNRPLPTPEEEARMIDEIVQLLAPLDEREREVLKVRLGLDRGMPRSIDETAAHFGLTTGRIRQIEERAMDKLRFRDPGQ